MAKTMAGTSFGTAGGLGLLLAVAVAGCGGGDLGPMTGRQLLTGRDFGDLFFWKARTLAFTRDTADPSQPEPQDILVWPLDEPAPSVALSGVNWTFPRPWPQWVIGDLLVTGVGLERVYDIGTRQSANLFTDFVLPPPDGGMPGAMPGLDTIDGLLSLTTVRSDGQAIAKVLPGGRNRIVIGRPTDLRTFTMPEGSTIGGMMFLGVDLALLVRQPTEAGDVVGVQRLDASTGALTTLVPPTAADEWVGVTGFCDQAASDSTQRCGLFSTFGCSVNEPSCPDGAPPPCFLLYGKIDPDDKPNVAAYVHDVGAATDARLAGSSPD